MTTQVKKSVSISVLVIAVLLALGLGYAAHWRFASPRAAPAAETAAEAAPNAQAPQLWYCAMHPHFIRPGPGKCGICGMSLVPMPKEMTLSARVFQTSPEAAALMDIETSPVERRSVEMQVRMVGIIAYDETRLADITAWVPGRLDRLFVNYTGVTVEKGQPMADLYSPELLGAQEELLQAIQAVKNLERSELDIMRETAAATVTAAREKLRLLGLAAEQIADVEKQEQPADHVTIHAPISGTVIHQHMKEGGYVKTGTPIYTLADLSQVWVKLDAYESDLSWLRLAQQVEFSTIAYPGETFPGIVAFIDPVLDPATRTVKIRVNAANADGRLKPGMFVKAVVRATLAEDGGLSDPSAEQNKPLVIPATAPLITGTRAVVYVALPETEKPTFEGREIVLGPRAGNYYLVRNGLKQGERVVTRGNFKIDSALQIQAKPSMMNPTGGKTGSVHQHQPGMSMPPPKPTLPPRTTPKKPVAGKPVPKTVINARCPIMGTALDRDKVPAELTRAFRGQKIGFCCAGCPAAWDKLADAEKAAKLEAAMPADSGEHRHE